MKKENNMNLQVLVSTMHQTNHGILEQMKIDSDAIIVNQCDRNEIEEVDFKGNNVKVLSLAERGVGLSRNTALMRATADVCLFADDDVTYIEGYKEIILNEFMKNPKADIILFNVPSTNANRPTYMIKKNERVRIYNCLRYGAVKIAVRIESIKRGNIYFSTLFGGGAKYSAGEDSLFLAECIKKGLKVYTNTQIIGYVRQEESSWFNGYTDKYFIDKGVFYRCLSKRWAKILSLQFILRHGKLFKGNKTKIEAFKLMVQGIEEIKYEYR